MSDKPLKIKKVNKCVLCPFFNDDSWTCSQGGSPLTTLERGGNRKLPADCPLINANICVELEK